MRVLLLTWLFFCAGTEDPSFTNLATELRERGVRVLTLVDVAVELLLPAYGRTALMLAAVEQALLAGGQQFYFSPANSYADQIITLREHLGMPGTAQEREIWTVHAYIPEEEKSVLPRQELACQLGPEE